MLFHHFDESSFFLSIIIYLFFECAVQINPRGRWKRQGRRAHRCYRAKASEAITIIAKTLKRPFVVAVVIIMVKQYTNCR